MIPENVKIIMLPTGRKIIGEIIEDISGNHDLTKITVNKPVFIDEVPVGNGQVQLLYSEFMSQDISITFNKVNLLTDPYSPSDDILKNYMEMTSKLSLPPKSKLIM